MKKFKLTFAFLFLFAAFSFNANAQKNLQVGTLVDGVIKMTVTNDQIKKRFFLKSQVKDVTLKDVVIKNFGEEGQLRLFLVVSCKYRSKSVNIAQPLMSDSGALNATTTTHTCVEDDCSGGCYFTTNRDGSIRGCGCNKWLGSCKHSVSTTTTEVNLETLTAF